MNGPESGVARPGASDVVRNTALGAVQQAVAIGMGVILLPYMLRQLGAAQYGMLMLLQIFGIGGVLAYADVGLHNSLIRFFAGLHAQREFGEFKRLLTTSFVVFLGIGALCGAIVLVFAAGPFYALFHVPREAADVRASLYLYAASFMFHFPAYVLKAFYSGVQDLPRLRLWEILERLVYGVTMIFLLLYTRRLVHVVVAEQIVIVTIFAGFLALAAARHPLIFRFDLTLFSWVTLQRISSFSGQVFLNRLSFIIYQKAPEILIGSLLGPIALTHLAIVSRIPRVLKMLGAAVNNAVYPAAAALDSLELSGHLQDLIQRGARYVSITMTPLVAFVVTYAPDILRLWVGEEYVVLADLLRGFVVWQYLMLFIFFMTATMTRVEQYMSVLPFSIAGSLGFLVVAGWGIPRMGLWAVLGGLVLGALAMAVGILRVQQRMNRLGYRQFYTEVLRVPVVYGGLLGLVVFQAVRFTVQPQSLQGLALVFAVLYIGTLLFIYRFAMPRRERDQVATLLRRLVRT